MPQYTLYLYAFKGDAHPLTLSKEYADSLVKGSKVKLPGPSQLYSEVDDKFFEEDGSVRVTFIDNLLKNKIIKIGSLPWTQT